MKKLISQNVFLFLKKKVTKSCEFNLGQCGKIKDLLFRKKISSNQLFSNFFSKNVIFTKFLPKMCDSKFPLCLAQKIRVPSVFTKKDHSIIKRFHEKYQVRFLSRSSTSYSNLIGASLEIC